MIPICYQERLIFRLLDRIWHNIRHNMTKVWQVWRLYGENMVKVWRKYGSSMAKSMVKVWKRYGPVRHTMAHIWLPYFFGIPGMGMGTVRHTMAHIWRSILWISNPGYKYNQSYQLYYYKWHDHDISQILSHIRSNQSRHRLCHIAFSVSSDDIEDCILEISIVTESTKSSWKISQVILSTEQL